MLITSIELRGFKRMALNNVSTFIMLPSELIQLILGTNGSGKSSLIKELTPLPADPSDYLKDGSKTIKIMNRGRKYVLINDFAQKHPHSFEVDGEELNPGGTITVQRELVKQHFGITHEIHELLIGFERFHAMSLARRREWFTQLSDVSYDYALEMFAKLKEKYRDITGALKLAKKRYVAEAAKVISEAEETKLREDVERTLRELNLLIEQSAPLDRPVTEYDRDLKHGEDELTRLSQRLLRMRIVAPYGVYPYGANPLASGERDDWGEFHQPGFNSVSEVDVVIDRLRHEITAKETLINKAVSEHSKIEETIKILVKTGEAGVQTLRERIADTRTKRLEILQKRRLGIEGLDASNAKSALESVYEILVAIFTAMPANEDKRFSQVRLQELQATFLAAKDKLMLMRAEYVRLSNQKTHIEAHKNNGEISCPQCKFSWVVGYSEEKYKALLELIAKQEEDIAAQVKAIEALELDIQGIREYSEFYKDYMRCVRNWPVLNPFWDYLLDGEYVTKSPKHALSQVHNFREDLEHEVAAKKLDEEIEEVQRLILAAEQVGDANLSEMQQKLTDSTVSIENLTEALTRLKAALNEYLQYRKQLADALELGQRIETLMQQQEQLTHDLVEALRRDTLNHCTRQLQHALAIKQDTLSAALLRKNIVIDLDIQIKQFTLEEEATRLLIKELSPTDGLIAEGLLGFIRNYTSQMNALIRKIWSYPLQVLDCGVANADGAELDYKFPLMVQTKTNVVPDVKLGSTGMREIVDLAFKVVAMRYLGLAESSLYLDEFGASFDEAHRHSAMQVIKNLMEHQAFTQLFMVSHYEASYGAFTNAEVCVLCPSNISVPAITKYNQHVTIH